MKSDTPVPPSTGGLLKGIALLQLGLALFRVVVERASWPSISMTITGALLMIFCAREKVNDERVEHLKLKAAQTGLLWGTLAVMLTRVVALSAGQSRPQAGSVAALETPLSATDALGLVMLIALGCYYWWRWQDGRTTEPAG